ncbi:PDZ domain-containing protein [Thauera humireducens]
MEDHRDGVRIVEVTAGSLAAHTGLRAGDIIVDAAGAPLKRSGALAALVREQPPGTWLPLKLRRDKETLDFVVRFPARK